MSLPLMCMVCFFDTIVFLKKIGSHIILFLNGRGTGTGVK